MKVEKSHASSLIFGGFLYTPAAVKPQLRKVGVVMMIPEANKEPLPPDDFSFASSISESLEKMDILNHCTHETYIARITCPIVL